MQRKSHTQEMPSSAGQACLGSKFPPITPSTLPLSRPSRLPLPGEGAESTPFTFPIRPVGADRTRWLYPSLKSVTQVCTTGSQCLTTTPPIFEGTLSFSAPARITTPGYGCMSAQARAWVELSMMWVRLQPARAPVLPLGLSPTSTSAASNKQQDGIPRVARALYQRVQLPVTILRDNLTRADFQKRHAHQGCQCRRHRHFGPIGEPT